MLSLGTTKEQRLQSTATSEPEERGESRDGKSKSIYLEQKWLET